MKIKKYTSFEDVIRALEGLENHGGVRIVDGLIEPLSTHAKNLKERARELASSKREFNRRFLPDTKTAQLRAEKSALVNMTDIRH